MMEIFSHQMEPDTLSVASYVADGFSDSDLIPEELQNELMTWREVFKKGQFRIGDISAAIVSSVASRGIPINHERVFEAVGRYCGKSARTVRYYYETAVFFPEAVRSEYDMLPFSHFVFARSMGERWKDVLEHAKQYPSMSEDALRYWFTAPQPTIISSLEPGPSPSPERREEIRERSQDNTGTESPEVERHSRIFALNSLYRSLDALRPRIASLRASGANLGAILEAIDTLRREIPKLLKCL